jgi:nitroreductase
MSALREPRSARRALRPHPGHERIVAAAVCAPSAHNAQPWRLAPLSDEHSYELHYDAADYLPHDPEDRDAGLAMGAFYESIAMAADLEERSASFSPRFTREGSDLLVGVVTIERRHAGARPDPLAPFLSRRMTNRSRYELRPLDGGLIAALTELGCQFRPPKEIARLIAEASKDSWSGRQFVHDLREWMRFTNDADDGMTPEVLALSRLDVVGLRLALRMGRLPRSVSWAYAARDVRLATAAPAIAVMTAPDMTLPSIFDAGRRLLRAWVTVVGAGAAYHPWSIVIDEDRTRPMLADLVGAAPMAMFRVGYPTAEIPRARRRPVETFLRPPSTEG